MAKPLFDEKELASLRDEIRSIRQTLDSLKAHPAQQVKDPEYAVAVQVRSDLPPNYAVVVRQANALPPDYAVLVRNLRPVDEPLAQVEYNVAVRPSFGALPPDYAVLVQPSPLGPQEVLVVSSLAEGVGAKAGVKAAKTKGRK